MFVYIFKPVLFLLSIFSLFLVFSCSVNRSEQQGQANAHSHYSTTATQSRATASRVALQDVVSPNPDFPDFDGQASVLNTVYGDVYPILHFKPDNYDSPYNPMKVFIDARVLTFLTNGDIPEFAQVDPATLKKDIVNFLVNKLSKTYLCMKVISDPSTADILIDTGDPDTWVKNSFNKAFFTLPMECAQFLFYSDGQKQAITKMLDYFHVQTASQSLIILNSSSKDYGVVAIMNKIMNALPQAQQNYQSALLALITLIIPQTMNTLGLTDPHAPHSTPMLSLHIPVVAHNKLVSPTRMSYGADYLQYIEQVLSNTKFSETDRLKRLVLPNQNDATFIDFLFED